MKLQDTAVTTTNIRASAITSDMIANDVVSTIVPRKGGWIKQTNFLGDYWVSPNGRLAKYPGAPFFGTLSKEENERIRRVREPKQGLNSVNIKKITLERVDGSRRVSNVYDIRVYYDR